MIAEFNVDSKAEYTALYYSVDIGTA